MNIVIIGTGYVGLVTGVGLASLGNFVNFIDLDENKIKDLHSKKLPFTSLDSRNISMMMKHLKECLFRQIMKALNGTTLILFLSAFKHLTILKQIL